MALDLNAYNKVYGFKFIYKKKCILYLNRNTPYLDVSLWICCVRVCFLFIVESPEQMMLFVHYYKGYPKLCKEWK